MLLLTSSLLLFAGVSINCADIMNSTNASTLFKDINIEISPYEKMDGLDSHEYNYYDDEDTDCYSDLTRCIYASPQSYPVCAYDVRQRRLVDFFDLCEIEFQNCEYGYNYTTKYPDRIYPAPRYLLTGDGYLCMAYLGPVPTPTSRRSTEIYYNLFFDDKYYNVTNLKPDLNITELLKYHFKSPIFLTEHINDNAYIRKLLNSTTYIQ